MDSNDPLTFLNHEDKVFPAKLIRHIIYVCGTFNGLSTEPWGMPLG